MDYNILWLAITLVLSAWFAGVETVFLSFNKTYLPVWMQDKRKGSYAVNYLLQRPERFLVTTLTGDIFANVIFTSIFTLSLSRLGISDKFIIVIAPLMLLIFGEAIPKTFARQRADQLILFVAKPLYMCRIVMFPAVKSIELVFHILLRWLRISDFSNAKILSKADIADALKLADRSGSIPVFSRPMIRGLINISDKRASDIMTPRISVVGAMAGISRQEAISLMAESGHSRLPYYQDNIDNVHGVITVRTLLASHSNNILNAVRKLPSVPASLPVIKLLAWFRKNRVSFAAVIDEWGGFAGVVSIEDLVEELVGPIQDEFDPNIPGIFKVLDNMWLIDAKEKLSHIQRITGFEFNYGKATSMGGFVIEKAGEIPAVGEIIVIPSGSVQVMKASPSSVDLIRLTVHKADKS